MFKKSILLVALFVTFQFVLAQSKVSLLSVDLNRYSMPLVDNTLLMEVKNEGKTTITSLNVSWTDGVLNKSGKVETVIKPGKTAVINHPVPVNFSDVSERTLTASVSQVNGERNFESLSASQSINFNTLARSATKAVVFEEATGTWCGWCVRGIVAIEEMNEKYPETFIGIAVHNSDPMVDEEYDKKTGITGLPKTHVDRVMKTKTVAPDLFEEYYQERIKEVAPADVSATGKVSGDKISVTAKANFYTDFSDAKFRLGVIVVENGVTGTGREYDQKNYYSDGSAGKMGGFENKPNPIPAKDMVYDHVGRSLLGGYEGQPRSVPSSIKAGDTAEYTFEYTVPSKYNKDNLDLVVVLLNEKNGAIVNGKSYALDKLLSVNTVSAVLPSIKMYPNPASNYLNISFNAQNEDYSVTVYTLSGKEVLTKSFGALQNAQNLKLPLSGLKQGSYLVSVSTKKASYSKVIIVK